MAQKKSTSPTVKHQHCPVEIIPGPYGPHAGKIHCVLHDTFVCWATKDVVNLLPVLDKSNVSA
jgi:hypothetical protein